jgi:hypothetical protein
LRGGGVGVCSGRGLEYDEQLNDSARYMQQQANNWGTTYVYLAFCLQNCLYGYHISARPLLDSGAIDADDPPLLYCEQLLRFTAVVVGPRCVGFSDSGIG